MTGLIKVNGQIRGTPSNPAISGIANISNGSLGREGIYTTLSGLSGDVRFNENRITLDKVEGRDRCGHCHFPRYRADSEQPD